MCAEEDSEDVEEEELTCHQFASQLVDRLFTRVPSTKTFQPAIEIISTYVNDPNPWKRRAAITVISVSFHRNSVDGGGADGEGHVRGMCGQDDPAKEFGSRVGLGLQRNSGPGTQGSRGRCGRFRAFFQLRIVYFFYLVDDPSV